MKALVLNAINDLNYMEVANPKIKNNELLLKIKACGICSSDLDRVFVSGAYHYPIILGHEIAGEIVDIGANVNKVYLGKRAVVFPLLPCFECQFCKNGFYAQCQNYNYFGSRCDGGYAEYLSVPLWNIKTFSDDIDYKLAALCEPACVAWHSTCKANVRNGDKILILGSGLIGITIAFWAKRLGADVYFKLRDDKKIHFLKSLGFLNVFKENDIADFDICFECVGSNESVLDTLKYVKSQGQIILVGNPKSAMSFDKNMYWKLLRQEINIKGVWNCYYPNDYEYVLSHLNEIPLERLITHCFDLSYGMNAFVDLKNADFKIKGMYLV